MDKYICIKKCFFNNTLCEEGVIVVAEEKDMKDNHCFKKVSAGKKKAETESKAEEILKQVTLTKEQ